MTTARLLLSLLGGFQVSLDGEVITDFASDSTRALLAYLAMHPDTVHRREALAGLLWPEVPERDARRNLRVTLSRLRDAIHDREVDPPFLEITRNAIAFPRDGACAVDVWQLRKALETLASYDQDGLDICDVCAERLETVDDLHHGEFLAGFSLDSAAFEAWVVNERERLHWEVLEALSRLTAYHEERGDYEAVITYARRQVALEPWREQAHRQWMRALVLLGRPNAALAQYEACRQVLVDELGVTPEAATTVLYEAIRDGALSTDDSAVAPTPVTGESTAERLTQVPAAPPTRLPGTFGEAASETPAPERRTLTVVHAEVNGADALLAHVGMEAWAAILSRLARATAAEIHRYGGEIAQQDDTKILALFGSVVAHEDDPERATLAALGMLPAFETKLQQLAQEAPEWRGGLVALDLRVLVHTGDAIVTRSDAWASQPHQTAIGDAVSFARRQLDAVPVGSVRVSAPTYRLTAPLFDWAGEGDAESAPVVHQPIFHRGSGAKGRGLPGIRSPLVGRDRERAVLCGLIAALDTDGGGIVTVVGEAGIGKSRLIAEARAGARPGLRWVEARCLSHSGTTAYALWISALHNLVATRPDATSRQVGRALREFLADLQRAARRDTGPDLKLSYPFLAYLLGATQTADDQTMLSQMEAPALQDAVFSAVERLFETLARQGPLIVVCEDLHWSDSLSLNLLARLLALSGDAPVLWICIFRPEHQHGCWRLRETAQIRYQDRHTDLVLQPLSDTAGGALLENLLLSIPGPSGRQTVEGLPEPLKDQILSRGEGNPYFVEEILRSLLESETIVCDAQTCEWRANSAAVATGIPDTLYGVLRGRIDRLPTSARHVLQLASVIGRVFSRSLLAEIANRNSLDASLALLQREQLIIDRSQGSEAAYVFRHQLTRDATYDALLRRVRRTLHRRVAEAIEHLFADRIEAQVGRLADHWDKAGEADRAVDYLRRAADRAAAQYANREALMYLERALALVSANDLDRRFALLASCTVVWDRLGAREEQWADITSLVEISEAEDDQSLAGQLTRAQVARLKATYFEHTGDHDGFLRTAREAARLAKAADDIGAQIEAESAWGVALSESGDKDGAFAHLDRALRLARESGDRVQEAKALRALALGGGAVARDAGWSYLLQALRIHREIGNRAGEAMALNALGNLALHRHHSAVAKDYLEHGLRLCMETGLYREEGWARATLGWGLHDLGAYDMADRQAREAVQCFRRVRDPHGEIVATVVRAWLARRLGNYAMSRELSEQGCRDADAVGALEPGIVAHLTLGDVLVDLRDLAQAKATYQEALSRAVRRGWPQLAVGAHAGLADVAMIAGSLDEALAHVRGIVDHTETEPELQGTFHPMRVYLICYRVLCAAGDPLAQHVLLRSHGILQAWANLIEDAGLRSSFLKGVAEHRELVAAFQDLHLDQN